jgi:hypothetical protein
VAAETAKGLREAGITPTGGGSGDGGGVPDMSTLPAPLRTVVEHAYGVATADLFLFATPCALLALLTVVFLKEKPLKTSSGMERLAEEAAADAAGPVEALVELPRQRTGDAPVPAPAPGDQDPTEQRA